MYDAPRLTKLDVVRYYDRIAPAMMPHVEGRPLTLVRCGEGIHGECFYMPRPDRNVSMQPWRPQ